MEALERASGVPECLGGASGGQSRPRDLWNVKRQEIPEKGRLGKGALVANSKGPWGVSWAVSSLGTAEGP